MLRKELNIYQKVQPKDTTSNTITTYDPEFEALVKSDTPLKKIRFSSTTDLASPMSITSDKDSPNKPPPKHKRRDAPPKKKLLTRKNLHTMQIKVYHLIVIIVVVKEREKLMTET